MVAGWGYILVLGVTDPLGGINTFFPLFGIANQLLAVIALAVVMAIVARRGNFKYLWVVVVPLAFAAVITVTASMYKIFSPVPAVGYWAQNSAFREALAAGETSFGTAKNVEAMEAVVRNTTVQGTLSILFVVLTLIVLLMSIITTVRAWQGHRGVNTEDPYIESKIYAPASLFPTPPERELEEQWAKIPVTRPVRHH
jgi:carbon starvation protein